MATGEDVPIIPEECREERLLQGLFTGTFMEYQGLITDTWPIDTRILNQRSLLHVATRLGKVDWVEGLLRLGADIYLKDESKVAAPYGGTSGRIFLSQIPAYFFCGRVHFDICENAVRVKAQFSLRLHTREVPMATGEDVPIIPEECKEERLLQGLFTGTFTEYQGLITDAWPIDTRILNQRSLLHVATRLGKVDWVEGLLRLGADIYLKDESKMTALEYAKEMASKHPDRSDRREVLRLLELLVSWGEVKKSAGRKSQLREDHLSPESHPTSLVDGSSPTANHTDPTEDASALTALKGSVDSLKEEITSLKTQVDELKTAVRGHNTLLECLERAVTSSSEKLTSLNEHVEPLLASGAAANPPPPINNQRRECIEAMMAKTDIFEGDKGKVLSFRRIYEYLYDQGNFTASLLLFLARKPHFKAIVDCVDSHISRIRPEFKHKSWSNYDTYNGRELSTQDWSSFADFPTSKVYLGGKTDKNRRVKNVASIFARTLTQMALRMAFKNNGMPYESNDIFNQEKFMAAFQEAEDKRMSSGKLDINIVAAMTDRERLIEFAPIVPSYVAFKGSTAGIPLLREQVPLLLKLYEDHLIPKLLAQA